MILHAISYDLRIVLDTDVMVAALRSPSGASRWLLQAVLGKAATAVISVPLVLEYEAVLTRPEHLSAARMTLQHVTAMIDALVEVSLQTRLSFRWRPLLADADDDMVLETAVNGGADLIATFNIRHFASVGESFGCRAVLPGDAVRIVANEAE